MRRRQHSDCVHSPEGSVQNVQGINALLHEPILSVVSTSCGIVTPLQPFIE